MQICYGAAFGGPGSKGSEGSACLWQAGSKGMVSPSAMSIKTALRDFPLRTVILSHRRRILVRGALGINGIKYQSAGRVQKVQRVVVSPYRAMNFRCRLQRFSLRSSIDTSAEGAYLASAAILYNYPGRSPQTACKAKPITGRTLGAQGRQPRRRHQPSAAQRLSTFGNTAKRQ